MADEEAEAVKEVDEEVSEEDQSIPAEHDIDALRQAQDEARAVLDHQIQTFTDVDDKAAKTFRLDAILLGLLVTAASFIVRSNTLELSPFINTFTVGAVIALIVSFISAVLTYTSSEIGTGVNPEGLERLISKRYTEKEWLILLLRSEADWMRENDERQSTNVRYLYWSHATLIIAILSFTVGIITALLPF